MIFIASARNVVKISRAINCKHGVRSMPATQTSLGLTRPQVIDDTPVNQTVTGCTSYLNTIPITMGLAFDVVHNFDIADHLTSLKIW